MAAMVSMNMPTKIRKRLMSSRIRYLLVVRCSIASAIMLGMCSLVRMKANTFAKATRAMIAEAEETVSFRQEYISLGPILR